MAEEVEWFQEVMQNQNRADGKQMLNFWGNILHVKEQNLFGDYFVIVV